MRPPDDDLPKRLPPLGWRSLPECRPPDASPSMFIDTRSCAQPGCAERPRSRVQLEMGAVCDTCGGSRSIYSVRRHSSLSAMHSHCMRALFSCAVWPVCGYRWIFSTGQRDLT